MIEDDNEIENIKTEATSPNLSRRKENDNYNNNNKNYGLCLALFFTFLLSDIGDKSQIATITIAAIYNLYGVILGTTLAFLGNNNLALEYLHKANFIKSNDNYSIGMINKCINNIID